MTLNEAYIKIGGMGRFQILMIITFMVMRNFGVIFGYATGITMM